MWIPAPYRVVLAAILLAVGWGRLAVAQPSLFLANDSTAIRDIAFTFTDAARYPPQFEAEELKLKIATKAPGLGTRLKRTIGFGGPTPFLLDPIELQKDVVRLRQFFRENGYLTPYVDYGASVLDTTNNSIRIVFNIEQGPPIIIQDVGFYAPGGGGYLANGFEGPMRQRWIDFRDRTSFKTGDRFTNFDLIRIEDQVLNWLKDRGYAFATLDTETLIDSTYNTADISFFVDPGPLSYFADIEIEGNRRISDNVVRRELPFEEGDLFSNRKLIQGQRELFGLNLFQVAQAQLPGQPRDSSVTVRYNLREAKLRFLTAETGYDRAQGILLDGQWSNRNFLGGARILSVRGEIESGLLAKTRSGTDPKRLFRASVALRQPYLFINGLSGIVEPFIQYEHDPLLRRTNLFANINRREFGVNTTLIYEILPFRTVSLQYTLSRATKFADVREDTTSTRDAYSKGILTLNGTFGWTNNFLNPRRGFLVRPFIEQGGGLERLLGLGESGVEYVKTGVEVVGYIPITKKVSVGTRLAGGRLWPLGDSKATATVYDTGTLDPFTFDPLFVAPIEDRFDPIRFYAGGSNDVRGWDFGLIGPKINLTECADRSDCRRDENGNLIVDGDTDGGVPFTAVERFEPIGGLARLVGNVEVRFPFPGLGDAWRAAVFLDAGQVSGEFDDEQDCPQSFFDDLETPEPLDVQCGFSDSGGLAFDKFKYGVGAGIRYETPIGYLRLDIAYKLNPDDLDLQTPRNAFLSQENLADPERSFLNHLNVHLSIGQTF